MATIPKEFIEDLIARTDLVELISPIVSLKRAGKNYTACCPFHDEKSPSFTVSPQKQFYYCFGCGANGNAISFLMDHQRLSFVESVEQLAAKTGVAMPNTSPQDEAAQRAQYRQRKALSNYLGQAAQYFSRSLNSNAGQRARQYLAERGFGKETIERFSLGWAPDEWQHFLKEQPQSAFDALEQAGLAISKNDQRYYERFRGRVMFPIQDQRGEVIGFGGRVLDDSKPKYLNSPETPLFHKQQSLYGWYQFLTAKTRPTFAVLVEGYTDVLALHQAGIEQALATLGTACSEHHLSKIFQHTNKLYFCFDGDNAGRQAALRAMQTVLPHLRDNRQIFFLLLPTGEDPHSLIERQGPGAFIAQMESAETLSEFLLNHLTKDRKLSRVDDRAQLVADARPLFSQLPEGLYRNLILDALAERTRINAEVLLTSLRQGMRQPEPAPAEDHDRFASPHASGQAQGLSQNKKPWRKNGSAFRASPRLPPLPSDQLSLVDTLISYLLQNIPQARHIVLPERIRQANLPGVDLLEALLEQINQNSDCSLAYLLGYWHNTTTGARLAQLAAHMRALAPDDLEKEISDALQALEMIAIEHQIEQALNQPYPDPTQLKRLLSDKAALTQSRQTQTTESTP